MSDTTGITWADSTFNPWMGCTKVSPGCDHCYAERDTARFKQVEWGPGAPRKRTSEGNWKKPMQWEREHEKFFAEHGHRRRVFCASLADVFDNEVDPQWRMDLFSLIAQTPNLDWLILTKRIGNVIPMCSGDGLMFDMIRERVWLGISVVNQAEADRDIPKLLAVPAAIRWLSMEPLLGPVHIGMYLSRTNMPGFNIMPGFRDPLPGIDWVVIGGESGKDARPMHPDWARNLRDQCQAAAVPFFFKQWGEWVPTEPKAGEDLGGDMRKGIVRFVQVNREPDGRFLKGDAIMRRVGKHVAGDLLDGVQHHAFPKVAA